MPKKFLRRLAPDHEKLKQHKHLQFLGDALHLPCLWHLNRRNVASAFAIGLFAMWLPVPFQSVIAALLSVYFRANLPIAVSLVFVSNPFTMPPMLYFAYEVGAAVVGHPPAGFNFEPSIEWLQHGFLLIWKPLGLGIFMMAVLSALLGYYGIHWLWRLHILQHLKERSKRHKHPQDK
ncbi:MAG TPA: DUF2062 domain-containing protein [Candidatus Thiothrix moscowensis]|uniref:DUF2062 domain-containing protein n=1 Tax=unclassified Thiothrix TaxID=2636184 RepID=UPI0025F0BC99|nr:MULTISPECIES: DUF2062 domain-containing protein [unclassified Thiothrix]HRJ53649.1 DUF2062 domain-containing protein [Candidatus Thiothrix moscowensis]HRJ93731.1 DUF2062 domain-containing protein [Candidatus Thiothrix moscowensis]